MDCVCASCVRIPHYLSACSPKPAICAFRVIASSKCAAFVLSSGFNERSVPELGQTRTHKHTNLHTHTQETAGCLGGALGHLEQPEHENWRGSNTHPLALLTQLGLFRDSLRAWLNSVLNHSLEKHSSASCC